MKKLATIVFAALFVAGATASAQCGGCCCGGAKQAKSEKKANAGQQGKKAEKQKKAAKKCGADCQKPCCSKKGDAGKCAAKK